MRRNNTWLKKQKKLSNHDGLRLPKLVRALLSRSSKHPFPTSVDFDYVSSSIARLHTYYRFNLTLLVFNGLLQTKEWRWRSTVDLTAWDAFKIGLEGCRSMFLSSGIDIMNYAVTKSNRETATVPPFVENLDMEYMGKLIQEGIF